MSANVKFSILVPVYNVEKYLKICLDSLIAQTYGNFEIILVDDGSTDSSGEICDHYVQQYSNIRVIHKTNQGLISARREAIKASRGEYCIFCDSDDFMELDALEQLLIICDKYEPDVIIYKAFSYIENKKIVNDLNPGLREGYVNKAEILDIFFSTDKINALWTKAVRREIIDIDKDYSSMYGFNFGEDFLQLAPILAKANSIYYYNKELYNYRIASGMMRKYNNGIFRSYVEVYRKVEKDSAMYDILDLHKKIAIKIIVAAIIAIESFQYNLTTDNKEINRIILDVDFIKSCETVYNTSFKKTLSIKKRILLYFMYHKKNNMIRGLIFIKRLMNK